MPRSKALHTKRATAWRNRKRTEKRCIACGQIVERGALCVTCKEKDSYRAKTLYKRRILAGVCVECGKWPPREDRRTCQDCHDAFSAWAAARYRRLRDEAIDAYGGKCVCCGEAHREFLALDHVGGGGNEHRRQDITAAANMARWAKKHGYPNRLRLLCFNCNWAFARYGECPHQRERHAAGDVADVQQTNVQRGDFTAQEHVS